MKQSTGKGFFYILFSLLFFSTNLPFAYAEYGIDPSWWASLAMAIEKGEVFGRDFIFNYGPLGYLNTGLLPKGISPLLMLSFHLFVLANFLFILKTAFDKTSEKWFWVGFIACIILIPWGFIADSTFTLLYFLIFWLLYVERTRNALPLLICVIIAVLIFYVKVNLSLIAYFVFITSLLYFAMAKIVTWRTVMIVFSILLGITFLFSIRLNVNIPAYLGASLHIIDAYQDGMAVRLVDGWELWTMLSFFFVILGVVLFLIFKNLQFFSSNLYLYLLIAMACFLNFKQAFTATGHYNIFGFFLFLPPLAAILYLFIRHQSGKLPAKVFIAVLCLQLLATQFIRVSYMGFNFKNYVLFAFPDKVVKEYELKGQLYQLLKVVKFKNPVNYARALFTYEFEKNFENEEIINKASLPKEIKDKIGSRGFDVIPWESSYAFFNKLNYQHRPVIQSYQANSEWLAKQNEAMYFSDNAPEYVLANVGNFRSQNPYWMDHGAYLALFTNYVLEDTIISRIDTNFLFHKIRNKRVFYESVSSGIGELKEGIAVPICSDPLYLKANLVYSLKGKIARLFFQPPYLMATLTYSNGKKQDFRIPPPILKSGVLINKKVVNQEEFVSYQLFKGLENENIVSIKMWINGNWGMNESFDYVFEKVKTN
jgi:hypothetical protein